MNIPTKQLKKTIDIISEPLMRIWNNEIVQNRKFPNKLKMADIIVTTVGGLEEDIMKAKGEKFSIGSFDTDDVELHEKGINRVGNLMIKNESYMNFEDSI